MMLAYVFAQNPFKGRKEGGQKDGIHVLSQRDNFLAFYRLETRFIEDRSGVPVASNVTDYCLCRISFFPNTGQSSPVDLAHSALSKSSARVVKVSFPQGLCSEIPESVRMVHPPFS